MLRKPDFLIVGAPKCATTSLYHYLTQHPDVFMPLDPKWKEPKFFGRDQWIAPHKCIRDEPKYLELFADAEGHQKIGEASPNYLQSRSAPGEIADFNPDMRIIASLRNPADLIISMHLQNLVTHNDNLLDIEEALAAEPMRAEGKNIPRHARHPCFLEYSRIVSFAENLERYIEAFGRENVLVLFFDDIQNDLAGTFKTLLEFIGVSTDTSSIDFSAQNESKSKDLKNWKIRGLLDRYPRATKLARKVLPYKLTHSVANAVSGFATYERPQVSDEFRAKVAAKYRPETEKLSALLGKDLSHWY